MARRMEKIREAGVNELAAQQKELTETIFRLRFQLSTGQAEALKRLRESKKDLARVNTLLRAHELTASRPQTEKAAVRPAPRATVTQSQAPSTSQARKSKKA
jgi:large subunit ribosomal protein L29